MPNDLIRKAHISNIRSALEKAADAEGIDHPGVKGRAREIFLKEILQPIIPPYVEFGSGKIVDSQGQNSGEIDVVVYS